MQYPEKDIIAILNKNKAVHTFFGNVIKPLEIISTASRLGGDEPEPFCKTIDRTVAPKWMKDVNGVNRTIVNVDKFVQAVTFQTCMYVNNNLDYNKLWFCIISELVKDVSLENRKIEQQNVCKRSTT